MHKNVSIKHHRSFLPQRPRQCGPVCFGSRRCRRCSSADPLHPAPVLLLWKRPHHPKSLRSAETSTAAGCRGCQQKPGRPRRPPLHAGYGELTHYNTPLLCNHKWKCIITNCFHAIAKIKAPPPPQHSEFLFHFLQFPYDLALILWVVKAFCRLTSFSGFYINLILHSLPVQNPQADHCRLQEVGTYCQESRRLDQWVPELVLQERWRVWHRIHKLKQELSRGSDTHEPMLLMQGWPRVDYHDWPAGTKGLPFQSGDWFTKSVLCQTDKQKTGFPFRPHFSIISQNKTWISILRIDRNVSTPQVEPGILVFSMEWTGML